MADQSVRPGDVAVLPLLDGAYGACQITGVDKQVIAAYAYDWYSAQPPTLDELRGARGLRRSHHNWDGRLAHLSTIRSSPMPPGLRWLGNLPLPDDVPALSNAMSGWHALADDVIRQRCWDELPDAVKDAYRTGATRGPVEVDFGAGPVVIGAATPQIDLSDGRTVTVPKHGPVRWSALDLLPRCTTVTWSGPDRELIAALASRPIVSSLTWHDAPAEVDLSETRLITLRSPAATCGCSGFRRICSRWS